MHGWWWDEVHGRKMMWGVTDSAMLWHSTGREYMRVDVVVRCADECGCARMVAGRYEK